MSSSPKIDIEKLAKRTAILEEATNRKKKCFPTMLLSGVATPVVVGLILYFLQPSFVQKQEGGKYVRDGKKLGLYTLGISFAIWVLMYLYTYCSGSKNEKLCYE